MDHRLAAVCLALSLAACGSDGSGGSDKDDEQTPGHSVDHADDAKDKEDDATAQALIDELDGQNDALKAEIDELEGRLTALESELGVAKEGLTKAEAAVVRGDADAKAQATIAAADQKRLEGQLEAAKKALSDAQALVADRSYDEAIAELKAVRRQLEDVEEARAQAPGTLGLHVALRYGDADFALDHAYALGNGTLSFSTLRYWLTNLVLIRSDDTRVGISNAYYLMGAMTEQALENGTQKALILPAQRRELVGLTNVPPGSYKAVEFKLGVDAEHNDDLSLGGGELNVLRNMTGVQWMWFTSYIFTKTQASFTPSAAPSTPADVRWDNGTNADLRTVRVELTAAAKVDLTEKPQVNLELDVAKVVGSLDPATTPTIGATDIANRTALADRWSQAFAFKSVSTQNQ